MASNIKVLVADDEVDILNVMAKKIAMAGYQVISADDGQLAWEKIQKEAPDVIVLDLNMPGLHGFEVLKNVREKSLSPKWQPVIIVSARRELEDLKKGYELEADHYLSKPCTMDDLLKSIKMMIKLIPLHK